MEQFKSWEDMTDLEQAQCTYWDMYKDAYGHRPRGVDTSPLGPWQTLNRSLPALAVLSSAKMLNARQPKLKPLLKFEQSCDQSHAHWR
jgi:hypothetical protein